MPINAESVDVKCHKWLHVPYSAAAPCFEGVLCTDMAPPSAGRRCGACPPGYSGDGSFCVDADECADGNNGGCDELTECVNVPGGRTCGYCPAGYRGSGATKCRKNDLACSELNGGCDW